MAGAVAILSGFIVCNGFGQVDICGTSAAEGLRAVAEGLRTGPGSVFRQEGNRLRPGFRNGFGLRVGAFRRPF